MLPKAVKYSLVDLPYPMAQVPVSSTRIFIEVINNTFLDVYACDFDGNRTLCPQIRPSGYAGQSLIIRSRSMNNARMKEEATHHKYGQPDHKYTHCQFEISVKDLQKGDVFYIKELGYTFSINEDEVLLQHPKLDLTIEKKIAESIAQLKDSHQDAIIKCVINDPFGRFKNAYIGMYGHVFHVKVSNKEHLEAKCDIYCRNLNGEYDTYTVDIEDLAKGICEIEEFDEKSMCICTDKESVHAWVFRNKGKYTAGFSKEEIEKIEKDLKKHYESIISERDEEIKSLKHRNDLLSTSYQEHLQRETLRAKHLHETKSMIHGEAIEDLKYKKEVVSARASDISATSNIVKAAGIIIPAVVGLAIFFSKSAAAASSALAVGPVGLLASIGIGLCKYIGAGISWLFNLFC